MSAIAYMIAGISVVHFMWSYYATCYKRGYTLDIWHLQLLYKLFIIHLMLPFAKSDLNVLALGPYLLMGMQRKIYEAYFISAFGYWVMIFGGMLWSFRWKGFCRRQINAILERPARWSLQLIEARSTLFIMGLAASMLQALVLLIYFKVNGFGFNLRGYLLVNPSLRPLAQFTAFFSTLIGSYCLVRFYEKRERGMLFLVSILLIGLAFFGERANIASVFGLLFVGLLISKRRKIRLKWIFLGGCTALVLSVLLDLLRSGSAFPAAEIVGSIVNVFYGNSFSDTRDFAIVLSRWDGHYFYGLTYLAAIFAFVPRFLSPFRDTWALGVVTATIAGFSPSEHPGLRVGNFGEAYLNFGLIGVVVVALISGLVIRMVDTSMKKASLQSKGNDFKLYSFNILTLFVTVAQDSAGASTLYTTLLILGSGWVITTLLRRQSAVQVPRRLQ